MSLSSLLMPFNIGDVMWLPMAPTCQVRVTCPVCAGQLAIKVTLGSGEEVGVPCEACGLGFDGPRGYIEEWVAEPRVVKFIIIGVVSFRGLDEWEVKGEDGSSCNFASLFTTEAEAMVKAESSCADHNERNMETRQRLKKNVKRAGWSVLYHRQQIKDLERQLAWHQARVSAKQKDKA